ncbi:aminopeptidase N [Arthrobacter frigidicola]|nr:aminopeptidase N [Arthrobacter frigidicola]
MRNENLLRDEAAARSLLIRVERYDVRLDLSGAEDPSAEGFPSESTVVFRCTSPGASTFLDFIHGGVDEVLLNGKALDLGTAVDGSRIHLPDLLEANTVTVRGTALYSRSGEGMHRFVDPADGRTYLYTQYEPADARRVFANFEQPDLKAAFTFTVTAPEAWTVASNAPALGAPAPVSAGTLRWEFAPTERISTYITSVLAGPYHHVAGSWAGGDGTGSPEIALGLYCRRSLASAFDAEAIFDTTRRGLDFFHRLFDYPYPFGKYDQAFVPEYNLGAMENPGLVTFTENYVFRSAATAAQYEARANTILHEMAHMWFGDLVTMTWWDDLWLKESFADYMGALGVAEATEWKTSWVSFANKRKAWAYVQDQLPTTHPIVADIPNLEAAKQNFDGITYAKGASVLKQLVAYVGFDAFTEAARKYFRAHAFGNTTLADLLAALSEASGQDMTAWARQWLQTSGVPALTAEVSVEDGVYTAAAIRQDALDPITGVPEPRPHSLKVGFYSYDADGSLVRTESHAVEVTGASAPLDGLVGRTQPDLLLVNDEDLTYAKLRFDPRSLVTLLRSVDRIADPLARAICLSALWSSTRDADLAAADYLGAVELAAPAEPGVGVLQVLLQNAGTAVERYTAPAGRAELRKRYARFLEQGLRDAAESSDLQLAWARALATGGRTTGSAAAVLRGLLDGTDSVPGLVLDDELRWMFLAALAAQGLASVDELEAELARDNTASGKAAFTLACSAVPDAAVKDLAWREAVFGTRLSNELLSATIEGFTLGGPELTAPYNKPYFEALREVWEARGIEMATRVVRGLYPGRQDLQGRPEEHPVLLATDGWLAANPDAPGALRRILVEERDHLLRSLTAQAYGTR